MTLPNGRTFAMELSGKQAGNEFRGHARGNISDRLGASGNTEDEEDFIPLKQGTDKSLGYHSTIKVRQKRPGKRGREHAEAESNRSTGKDLQQSYDYKDRNLTARGQESQFMPQSRPDSNHEVKLEREPGKRDQTETESNRSIDTTQQGFYYDRRIEQFSHADQDYYITAQRICLLATRKLKF